jgi:hypothetical protein
MQSIPLILGAVSAASQLVGGIAGASSANAQARELASERKQVELDALTQENDRRRRLVQALAAQDVEAAHQGISLERSATLATIREADIDSANTDIGLIRAGAKNRINSLKASASSAVAGGRIGLFTSALAGGASLLKGIDRYNKIRTPDDNS